jgi:oligosaccharide translocation protein RFT1
MSSLQNYAGTLRSLIGLQVVSRLTSFGLNQSLVRIASPTVYGTAAIQFDLVRDTVLFLGREAIRGVVLRAHVSDPRDQDKDAVHPDDGSSSSRSQVLNLTLLAPLLGILVGLTVIPTYVSLLPKETTSQSVYTTSLCGYLVATILELSVEPFMLGSQIGLFKATSSDASAIRARIEGAGVVVRAAVTFACLFAATQTGRQDDQALLAFACGQIAYSAVVIGGWAYATGYDAVVEVALQAKRMLRDGISLAFRYAVLSSFCSRSSDFLSQV